MISMVGCVNVNNDIATIENPRKVERIHEGSVFDKKEGSIGTVSWLENNFDPEKCPQLKDWSSDYVKAKKGFYPEKVALIYDDKYPDTEFDLKCHFYYRHNGDWYEFEIPNSTIEKTICYQLFLMDVYPDRIKEGIWDAEGIKKCETISQKLHTDNADLENAVFEKLKKLGIKANAVAYESGSMFINYEVINGYFWIQIVLSPEEVE